jgi:iron complex transport system substrate-binding protein
MRLHVLLAAAATVALTACGSTEAATSDRSNPPGSSSSTAGPVTVTDARGRTVTLPKPATKVVTLEWSITEDVVTLGVTPAGAADTKGYATWVKSAPLPAGVADLGTRGEPSIDAIVGLEPDLIFVGEDDASLPAILKLETKEPVVVIRNSDAKNGNIAQMRKNFEITAQALGKQDKAAEVLAGFDKAVTDAKAKLVDVRPKDFLFMDGWVEGAGVGLRPYGHGALLVELGQAIGLTNAWTGRVNSTWGLGTTDVEGLSKLGDLQFFYINSEGTDVFKDVLANNAIWKNLPFVKNGHLHELAKGIWLFGGPLSCSAYVTAVARALTA